MNASSPRRPPARSLLQLVAAAGLAAALPLHAAIEVPVEIDMRAAIAQGRFDPARDSVGVRGSQAPLSWEHTLAAAAHGEGRYGLTIRFERAPFGNQPVQYKFRIERAGQGPDDGWEPGRNHPLLLDGAPRVTRAFGAEPAAMPPPRRTGTIERLGVLASTQVAPRAVQVWLPPGYAAEPSRRYPVLYLHDGQNVFDDASAGAEWMADETAQRLVEQRAIEPLIIVAVESLPATRALDYTPTAVTLPAERTGTGSSARTGGGVAAYGRFLADELKPLIDTRYRTRPERAATAVGGSSFGGLAALALVLDRADVFGAALVVSPSLWWDDRWAERTLRERARLPEPRPRLWLDMGAQEGEEALPAMRALKSTLLARGWSPSTLAAIEDPDGSHDEASWASRVEGMLRFLYAPGAAARP